MKNSKFFEKYGIYFVIGIFLILFLGVAFLTKDNKNEASTKSTDKLLRLSVTEWNKEIQKDEYVVTVLTQTGCSWCQKFEPIAKQIAEEIPVKMIWIDLSLLKEDQYKLLLGTFEELKEFGTPHSIITKSGKLVGQIEGYREKSDYIKSLKEKNVID